MELNKCTCGATPRIIIYRNPYEPDGCYVGKVVCNKCKTRTHEYGLSSINKEFLIKKWNDGNVYFIDGLKNID